MKFFTSKCAITTIVIYFTFCLANSKAQIITTVAGGSVGDGGKATLAVLSPQGIAMDGTGNIYIADGSNRIRKIDKNGNISTIAGNGSSYYNGSAGIATNISINPNGVAVDSLGNIYIADSYNNRIRRLSNNGILKTIAGDSIQGYSGDGGLATVASLNRPTSVAVDNGGNVYIADYGNNRIRKVDVNHIITTVAGNGFSAYNGDGGKANITSLNPSGIAVDFIGNLYISDFSNNRIRKVDTGGIITTIAGGFGNGFNGDGILAVSATLWNPKGVSLDSSGNLYIADQNNNRIRKVNTKGIITTIAGGGYNGFGDGGKATSATLSQPTNVFVDSYGNVYISDITNYRLRKVNAKGIITTVAGNGTQNFRGDGGQAIDASMNPISVSVDRQGNLYISDYNNNRIRKVDGINGIITTIAGDSMIGCYGGDGGKATLANLYTPSKTALDNKGNLYICDENNNRIRKVDTSGIITTFAGVNSQGYSGDGGLAIQAQLNTPYGVATDNFGNVFIAEFGNNRIRKVDTTGIISTVVGNGNRGYSGDGGLATAATLNLPYDVVLDTIGNLYLIDQGNNVIRKVDTSGIISTVAGTGDGGFGGDGDSAKYSNLNSPRGITIDRKGNLYISDNGNQRIRMVNTNGIISTIVGNGTVGYNGDGGLASSAILAGTSGISVDNYGNLYIADFGNQRIRKVSGFSTLPVNVNSFYACSYNKNIKAYWQTGTIANNVNFIIQHSTNGNSFSDIGNIEASGNGKNSYQFTDNNPVNGVNYYRLESIEKDGGVTFSNIVSVHFDKMESFTITPNPAKDNTTISFSETVEKATIAVYDITGKQVITQSIIGSTNSYKLNTQSLKSGLYVIKVNTATGNYNEKLLINK